MLLHLWCYPEKLKFLSSLGLVVKRMAQPQSLQEQKKLGFYSGKCFLPSQKCCEAISSTVIKQYLYLSQFPCCSMLTNTHTHTHMHKVQLNNKQNKTNQKKGKKKNKNKKTPTFSEIILARLPLFNRKVVIQCNNTSCMPEQEECHFYAGREIVLMYKRYVIFPTLWPNFTLSFSCREKV